ncbi:hypothetical protein [Lysinibacter sp. HNR]|uniref:hypothetical protein n=1 Tax=Lysinibacter sp. HNR TaxID=3031408 RepID=UPI0024349494|nr:hypothetical protein [Lysinibacter sp. HNR]WGD36657.1 hypothetical protein FrondiHNR_09325 [Lysinibacter sp. HNR]
MTNFLISSSGKSFSPVRKQERRSPLFGFLQVVAGVAVGLVVVMAAVIFFAAL